MRNFEQINKKTHLIIGILIEKSINIIPVIFGILKAGAAFLPIHSDTPDYRIKEIVKNSKIRILLIDQKSCNNKAKLFSEITNNGCEIINLDQYKLKDQFSESNLNYSKPDKLAYVIYTSGSTGIPKGVMIQHKSLMFFIEHQLNKFKINENEKIALIHSFSFDASIEQYCIALLSGACVVLYELTDYESPNDFLTALNNDEISHLDMTPSFLKAYDINRVPSIKRIITGGEACSKNLLEKYSQKRLINEYGPTEVTIVALQHFYRSGDPHHLIGRPISHLGAYIIDQHRNLQPKNTVGELAFSGPAVALGYLNDPKLTQEKFIDNQFKETFSLSNDHDTLYLTGDLAIMDDDGAIKFIGRKDNQVKIRGYRVELSEIEYHLCAHPEIIDSKVLVTSNDQISAYIVTKHCEICLDSLKNFLYERLPLYMIPNLFYRLDFIPTSENFKIDEKNITAHVIRLTHTGYEKPKSNLEQTIHSIWSKILAVEELGINDDFFALGGNSINCIDLMSKLENQGISLNIKEIYTNRTIKRMASYIESLKPNDSVPKPDFKNVSKLSKIFHLRLFKDLLRYINANEIESFISHYSPFIHATGKKSPSAATITYLLPPGNGGAESYLHDILINLNGEYFAFNNIVNALSNYFSDYIFQILTIENIADYYLYYIKNTSRNKYYQLFGWCFGGLISFEIARQAARLKKTNLTQLLMVDTYFDFKTASKIDHEKLLPNQDYCLLNYKYNPEFISNLKNIKVTLAKSVIADNQEDLSKQLVFKEKECGIHWFSGVNKYYAELTTTNHLDKLLRKENFETILIQRSHTKWSSDNQTVRYISMLLNSPESSTTHKRLNITSSKYIEA